MQYKYCEYNKVRPKYFITLEMLCGSLCLNVLSYSPMFVVFIDSLRWEKQEGDLKENFVETEVILMLISFYCFCFICASNFKDISVNDRKLIQCVWYGNSTFLS